MTLKPPTRSLPKLVMKEWPPAPEAGWPLSYSQGLGQSKSLSDFTRVVEETGVLDQERSQNDGLPSNEGSRTKSGD